MLRAGRLSEAEVAARSQTGKLHAGCRQPQSTCRAFGPNVPTTCRDGGLQMLRGRSEHARERFCKTAPASGWRPGVGDVRVDERACRLSRLSHRLVSRGRIQTNLLDNRQTLTCAPGPRRTHRTSGTRLRIRRVLVRVPSEQSLEASNQLSNDRRSQRRTPVDVPGLLAAVSREDTKA